MADLVKLSDELTINLDNVSTVHNFKDENRVWVQTTSGEKGFSLFDEEAQRLRDVLASRTFKQFPMDK